MASSGEEGGGDCTRTFFTIFLGLGSTGSSPRALAPCCSVAAVLNVVNGGGRGVEVEAGGGAASRKLALGAVDPPVAGVTGEGSTDVLRRKGLLEPKPEAEADMVKDRGGGLTCYTYAIVAT